MRKLRGVITSNKMKNTVVARVDSLKVHPKYKKYYRTSKKYKAHVNNEADYAIGDMVEIQETRPISKKKRWKVIGLVRRIKSEDEDSSETKQ